MISFQNMVCFTSYGCFYFATVSCHLHRFRSLSVSLFPPASSFFVSPAYYCLLQLLFVDQTCFLKLYSLTQMKESSRNEAFQVFLIRGRIGTLII